MKSRYNFQLLNEHN